MSSASSQRGMSLIETLIYIAILVILAVAAVGTLLSLWSVFERAAAERRIAEAATVAFERLSRDIRDADEINIPLSTLNATSSVLVLENGATTTRYLLDQNALVVEVEGVRVGMLNPASVTVTDFTAVRYDGTRSDAVRVQLGFQVSGRFSSTTVLFTGAAVLRGSYEE